jgi:hypothetical protein
MYGLTERCRWAREVQGLHQVKMQKMKRRIDYRSRKMVPYLQKARAEGMHKLEELRAFVNPLMEAQHCRPFNSFSAFHRALIYLRDLGLDPGPDDKSTARRLGRPTRRRASATE